MFELTLVAMKDLSLLTSSVLVLTLVWLLIMRSQRRAVRCAYSVCLGLFVLVGLLHMLALLLHWDVAINAALLLLVNNLLFVLICLGFWFAPKLFGKSRAAAIATHVLAEPVAAGDKTDLATSTPPASSNANRGDENLVESVVELDVQPQLAVRLIEFMRTQKPYLEPHITVERLAIKLQVSPKLLSATINSELQMNFFELISNYRVLEAKKRLADSSLREKPICEIMKSCGFNSKSVFNQAFKKAVGVTPSHYRQQHIQPYYVVAKQ